MDVRNVSGQPVQNSGSRPVNEGRSPDRTAGASPAIADGLDVADVRNDWRAKVRVLETEIRSLEEGISRNQVRQEGLVNIQNELLAVSDDELPAVRAGIDRIIQDHKFDGKPLLEAFRLNEGRSPYEYSATVEVEKNRLVDETRRYGESLKAKMVSKENLIFASNGISPGQLDKAVLVDGIKDYLKSIGSAVSLDNARIKDLLG